MQKTGLGAVPFVVVATYSCDLIVSIHINLYVSFSFCEETSIPSTETLSYCMNSIKTGR